MNTAVLTHKTHSLPHVPGPRRRAVAPIIFSTQER